MITNRVSRGPSISRYVIAIVARISATAPSSSPGIPAARHTRNIATCDSHSWLPHGAPAAVCE